MRKLRDDSTWNQPTPGQRETLGIWSFDENPGDTRAMARVQAEFGLAASVAGVGRFCRCRARARPAGDLNAKILAYFHLFPQFPLISAEGIFF